jgi:hypothetical protein
MATGAERKRDAESKAKIFISYSRKDMAFADKLEAALKVRNFEVLIDREEIYAFEDWWKRVETLIGRADTIVFVLSPDAVKSDVALKEVARAASLNKRFAPILGTSCGGFRLRAETDGVRRVGKAAGRECVRRRAHQRAKTFDSKKWWARRQERLCPPYGSAP